VNEPAAIGGWKEGLAGRQSLLGDTRHRSHVDKPGEEDDSERRAVVFEKYSHGMGEQATPAQLTAGIGDGEDEDGYQDRQIK